MERRIYVVIPTHDRISLLRRTLASLAACRLPEGYCETVVVENGKKAGVEGIIAETPYPHLRLRYLHVGRANKSHALNEALATLEEGLIVFFDDDVRFDAGVIEAYAEAAAGRDEGAYFGGPVRIDYEQVPPPWLTPLLPHSARGYELDDRATMANEYLGCNWAAFKSDIRRVGGFNPMFGPGSPIRATGQESNVQQRMFTSGIKSIDVPGASVWHFVPKNQYTPKWLLVRRYRMGVSNGKSVKINKNYEILFQLLRSIASITKRVLIGDHKGAFSAACGLSYNVGKLRAQLISGEPESQPCISPIASKVSVPPPTSRLALPVGGVVLDDLHEDAPHGPAE